jgi:hypothetical protein
MVGDPQVIMEESGERRRFVEHTSDGAQPRIYAG